MPSHGRFVGASSMPFSEYKRKPGDRVGHNWRIPNVQGKRAVRHVVFDTNYWKSFVHARLAVPMGDRGCLSLFGDNPTQHRLFAEHLTAEYRVKTEGRGRTVDEWKLRPERGDNHWLDCLVGCAVAASMQGAVLLGTDGSAPPKRERVSFAELIVFVVFIVVLRSWLMFVCTVTHEPCFRRNSKADLANIPVEFWKLSQGGPGPCLELTLKDGKVRS